MLVDAFLEPCVLVEKTRQSDSEGGWITVWNEGLGFQAAVVMDTTLNARVAEAEGMKAVYTVTTSKATPLDFHDVFKRVSDGKYFRVKSDCTDKQTPSVATFSFHQVNAEEWELS